MNDFLADLDEVLAKIQQEDSHSDWDGSFTMPTGGTYEASLPQGIEIRFTNGTFTSPKAGNYIYKIDGDGNLVYFKLKE